MCNIDSTLGKVNVLDVAAAVVVGIAAGNIVAYPGKDVASAGDVFPLVVAIVHLELLKVLLLVVLVVFGFFELVDAFLDLVHVLVVFFFVVVVVLFVLLVLVVDLVFLNTVQLESFFCNNI